MISHSHKLGRSDEGTKPHKKQNAVVMDQQKVLFNEAKTLANQVEHCNMKAVQCMQIQKWQYALTLLEQAENLLEAATTKGLPVDRYLVLCILHNEACCYQNLWKLEQCSNYVQALIFNLNNQRKQQSPRPNGKEEYCNKYSLAQYYLQFSAINSQLGNHSGALVSARKALNIIRKELHFWDKALESKVRPKSKGQNQEKTRVFNSIYNFNDAINLQMYETLLQAASYYLRVHNTNITGSKNVNKDAKTMIQSFTIKTIMQIQCMCYPACINTLSKQNDGTIVHLYDRVFILSVCYFTMATQLRILAIKKSKEANTEKTSEPQYKQSQMYHLFAILIFVTTVNVQSQFLQQLLSTYQNHYQYNLLSVDIPFKKIFNQLLYSSSPKNRQISIICSDQQDGLQSHLSKGTRSIIRVTKSSKQSQREYKFSLLDPNRKKSKSKTKTKSKTKKKTPNSKQKIESLSKSPYSKSPRPKDSLLLRSPKSKQSGSYRSLIPSIKLINGSSKMKLSQNLVNKTMNKQKKNSKSTKKGKYQDNLNDYFIKAHGDQKKNKKTSVSSKKSNSQPRSTGRLPINSTLQTKQFSQPQGHQQPKQKQKKKIPKKNLLQHYL